MVNNIMSESSGNLWLGIDVGTQGVRAMAVDAAGRVHGSGAATLTGVRDGVRHEQNPLDWWNAAAAAIKAAIANLPADRIAGVAVDATSGTIVLVDETGEPISPGLMYDDARAAGFVDRVREAGENVWNSLGTLIGATWALPKILWLIDHYRNDVAGVNSRVKILHQNDFIHRKLIGPGAATDSSHALKSGYDLLNDRWPADVFRTLGIDEHLLPPVVRPGNVIGEISHNAAAMTGLAIGTPVISGMTDGCAAQIGSGALDAGSWNCSLGTTLVLKGVSKTLVRDPDGAVYSHRSPGGSWLPGGASSAGAGVIAARFAGRDLDALSRAAADREPSRVLVYPLTARGERFPFVRSDAEGFIAGEPADEAELFAAVLQGVAFVERLCFDHLSRLGFAIDGDICLTGGATANRVWCQMRADVLDRPVKIPDNAQAALGMAILAAAATSGRSLPDAADGMVRVSTGLAPRSARTAGHFESYRLWIDELARRGWIVDALAGHARRRCLR